MKQRRPYQSFVSYIDRSPEYYAAQGYSQAYSWACHDDAPFTPLKKPLSRCRVGMVTTAGLGDMLIWAAIALVAQIIAYAIARLLFPEFGDSIIKDQVSSGLFHGALSVAIGMLNAASMTV
jgi:hypothetical protein